MKHKFIVTGLLAALMANGAQASEDQRPETEKVRLEEVSELLERLSRTGALEIDSEGNVRIKPSILNQLYQKGRVDMQVASFSSVCT